MFAFTRPQSALRDAITTAYRRDEAEAVAEYVGARAVERGGGARGGSAGTPFGKQVRENRRKASGVDALMHEFALSSEEGVALMCLAEALLRIPDKATRDRLIADKLSGGNWKSHLGHSPSMFVNAAAWGLRDYRQADRANG